MESFRELEKLPVSGVEGSNAVYLRMPAETPNMVS